MAKEETIVFICLIAGFLPGLVLGILIGASSNCKHKREFRTTIRDYLEDDCQSIRDVYVCEKCKKVKKVKL